MKSGMFLCFEVFSVVSLCYSEINFVETTVYLFLETKINQVSLSLYIYFITACQYGYHKFAVISN